MNPNDALMASPNDGFVRMNDLIPYQPDLGVENATEDETMGYYIQTDLPFYYSLASTFAVDDRYFSSVLGPTFPNRAYLYAATSFGHLLSLPDEFPPPGGYKPITGTILDLLDANHVSWVNYYSDLPSSGSFLAPVPPVPSPHQKLINDFLADAKTGNLPSVAFVDPAFGFGGIDIENDEHPPNNVQVGQAFVSKVTNALFQSPNWGSSALFFTYDEHGGFYDSLPPPPAPIPDNIPPMLQPGDTPGAFDRYGIGVPAAVVSPFSKRHFVSHVVHDHTSILRFIETRFGLPALTNRDAHADPMLEFFDFSTAAFKTPPQLPAAVIDPVQFARCGG